MMMNCDEKCQIIDENTFLKFRILILFLEKDIYLSVFVDFNEISLNSISANLKINFKIT